MCVCVCVCVCVSAARGPALRRSLSLSLSVPLEMMVVEREDTDSPLEVGQRGGADRQRHLVSDELEDPPDCRRSRVIS